MPDFAWKAVSASGKVQEGRTSAASEAALLRQLRAQGLTPIALETTVGAAVSGELPGIGVQRPSSRSSRGPANAADVLTLTSELAIMLRAGLALDNALRVLIEMSYKASVRTLLEGVLAAVKTGTPLSRALARHPDLFGDFYVNMIRSGEASGQLSAVLDRLVEHMERQRALRDNVVSATIYPTILLVVAVLSVTVMLGFVVPQFQKLFADMGDALPLPTRLVVMAGDVFRSYGLFIAAGLGLVGVWVARWWKTPAGRQWWQVRLLGLPLVGPLVLKYQLTLFSRSLGTLLGNGVPLLAAVHIATETVSNVVLRQALAKVAPIVKEGGRVVQAAVATGIFEPLAINLIRVGEETGRIGPMMLELANILNRDVENGIKRLLTLLEPALILVMGLVIATIIVSILMGILAVNDLAL
ncbi:MAG: type II secretion system F family protein [Burkholderiaceae bacterium]